MKEIIQSHLNIDEETYQAFEQLSELREYNKNEILSRPGKTVRHIYFLDAGLLRAYRIHEGIEFTHYFINDRWFFTDYTSYLNGSPGMLYLQALSACRCYRFTKTSFDELLRAHPVFERLGRIIAEQAYLRTAERTVEFQTSSLQERYHRLVKRNPELFREVPQKYIASYLGVTEQSLSRIKAIR